MATVPAMGITAAPTTRTSWSAIGAATALAVAGHWAIVLGGLLDAAGDRSGPAAVVTIAGLVVLPTSVLVVVTSEQAVKALALGAAVFVMAAIAAGEAVPVTATVAGLGTAAIAGMPRPFASRLWLRIAFVVVGAIYTLAVVLISPSFAVIVAPFLPFTSIGLADFVARLWWGDSNRTGASDRG